MRPRPDLILVATLAVALGARTAAAADTKPNDEPGSLFDMGTLGNKKDPITISSDSLEYDYKANVIVYRGDVQAAQGQVKIRSDTLRVIFAATKDAKDAKTAPAAPTAPSPAALPLPDPAAKGQQRLQEVTALGNVRIDQGTKWATGGKAVFDQSRRTLVLTETPVLHDGPNEVAGDRVVVFLDENRSVVEGGRKRVKAVLYPGKDDGLAPRKEGDTPAEIHPAGSDKTAAATGVTAGP